MNLPAGLTGRPIAHRGLWRAGLRPENSLAAFEAACAGGYGIELDVRLTADGEPVVFHDEGLERLTAQSGLVEERTLEELFAITLFGGEHQTIPSLAQALELVAGRTVVLVELKTPAGQEGLLEAPVAAMLEAYDGPCAALSFNAAALGWLARHRPSIPRGLNINTAPDAPEIELARADFLSINKALSSNTYIQSWRSQGKPAITWTVRSPEEMAEATGLVDNIIFEGFAP
ncbi:MAG TPA: glycerophosphodiester phosphodiesterase family protein [Caulobacteraceae bacterium]|nr:glycerophosphodiester phosphodiesterase family protein [Caulobacteraceae bacterium]